METILDKMQINLDGLFRTIKHPLVILDRDDNIVTSNDDAEFFFGLSRNILNKYKYTISTKEAPSGWMEVVKIGLEKNKLII